MKLYIISLLIFNSKSQN